MRCLSIALMLTLLFATQVASAADQPNIIWITLEDMSPTLGCYGDEYATSPNIDNFAQQSVRYTRAFASAPVCSPSRSCLITGCYATSLGTQQMRSAFPIPDFIHGFPSYLREAGYYTSNNFKTDYNTSSAERIIKESWDESSTEAHWRNRTEEQKRSGVPFFSVFNIMTSHQSRSMVWTQDRFRKEVQSKISLTDYHDPDKAPLPPYYPDNAVTRRIVARFYDCVTAADAQVGQILKQLEDDGLAEDTIVFVYSDHGSGMPRHKRLLHDSGMHVPLMIRFPEKWKHFAPAKPGETSDRLVSFVDFAPTILKLAGLEPKNYMQGTPFLGTGLSEEREYVYGHRDRIDEVIDMSRSIRDKRYLYIRNFFPQRSWNQFSSYSDLSEIRGELYYNADRPDATEPQLHYAGPMKPVEELYDCVADPHNTNNLIDSKEHKDKQVELAQQLIKHLIRDTRDCGFLPESYVRQLCGSMTQWEAIRKDRVPESRGSLFAIMAGSPPTDDAAISGLSQKEVSSRYWSAIALQNREITEATRTKAAKHLKDDNAAVRIEVANTLAQHGDIDSALPVLVQELASEDLTVVLHATRTIELLGKNAAAAEPAMKKVADRAAKLSATTTQAVFDQSGDKDLAMFCSFSANGFLDRLHQGEWIDLLEGKETKRWDNVTDAVQFDATNAQVSMHSKGKNLWMVHQQKWDNFELTVEAKMPTDAYNAGTGFRCELRPNGKPLGYQCEIAEAESGMLYAIGSGWVWPKGDEQRDEFFESAGNAFRTNKWNHFRIRCKDEHIKIWVNGILTTDVADAKHAAGRIALQHHGKGGEHLYRRLRVRSLSE